MSNRNRAAGTRLLALFWLDLTGEGGREVALAGGWLAALFAAASYGLNFAFGRAFGQLPTEPGDAFLSSAEIADLCAVVAGLALAWLIWKRASRLAAAIVLVWILSAAVMKSVVAGIPAAIVGIIFTLAAISALRASFAKHRLLAAGAGLARKPSR